MFSKLSDMRELLQKVFSLARPYGRKKLAVVFAIVLTQGVFQVIGVTSIFPFLAVASNPDSFRSMRIGEFLLKWLPPISNVQLLLLAGSFALFMLLFSNALMLAGDFTTTRYKQGFAHWLRMRLLRRILSNPYSYFLQRNTGELMKKTGGDVAAYVNGVLSPILEITAKSITVGFLLMTFVFINPLLALAVTMLFTVFYIGVFYFLKRRRDSASQRLKLANRGTFREIQQLLGGIKPVKVHGVEQQFLDRYAHHSFTQACLIKWFPIYQNTPRALIEPVAFGGIVVFVMVLAARGETITSQLPTLGVMALAGYRLIPNFQLLYSSATGISLMKHTLEEVYEEFHLVDAGDGQLSSDDFECERQGLPWEKSIRLDSVQFTYTGASSPVIKDLSLEIRKNQFVAFIGETGSGKSTLIDILLGLHTPQSGNILLDGKRLPFDSIRKWRAGIGYVPQDIFLRDDTIAANIAFGIAPQKIDMEQVRRVSEVAQIREFIENEMEEGFETMVGERGVRLSGGQRQRIGLARALYHNPSMLLLDEATSALDVQTEQSLMQAIESLYGNITLIVIAHRLSTIQKADVIFRLKSGTLLDQGTFEELGLKI